MLARHRKSCEDPNRPHRLRSCILCTESKVKCDRNDPCSRCKAKGRDCVFAITPRKKTLPTTRPSSVFPPSEASPTQTGNQARDTLALQQALFLPIDSLSAELADLTTYHDPQGLVHSHLSSIFENDVFQPFFSDVFSTSTNSTSTDEPPLPFPSLEELPLHIGLPQPWFQELLIFPQNSYPQGEREQRSLLNDFFNRELQAADPKHYCE